MRIPEYIDFNKITKEFTVVYSRVSSKGQDIKKQLSSVTAYIKNQNIDPEKVIWIQDDDISANKLKMEDRPGLMELRQLIKENKVKTIIAYSRDRMARNFYEYVALVKEFYHYDIDVIYTGGKQPPFTKKLSMEAIYGIFSQSEGQNIGGRRTDTNKQFPSQIFGYKKMGDKKNTYYKLDENIQNELKLFFLDVGKVNKAEELFAVFMKYKKILNRKYYEDLLRYLQNPFYSAHAQTLYGYEKMQHVEPLITLDDFIKNQSVLKILKDEIDTAITNTKNHGIIIPNCSICKTKMAFRSSKLGESGYYVCKKKHKEVKITVEQYHNLIPQHLKKILSGFSTEKMKKDIFSFLKKLEDDCSHKITILNRQLNNVHKEMTEKYDSKNNSRIKRLVHISRDIKQEIQELHNNLFKIEESRNGINDLIQIIKGNLVNDIRGYDLHYLCNILFSQIEIGEQSIIYHVTFGHYYESEGYHVLQA